jgi:hypothetical protein
MEWLHVLVDSSSGLQDGSSVGVLEMHCSSMHGKKLPVLQV